MEKKRVGIVYFIYINPNKNWQKIVKSQLQSVKDSGILKRASLYLEISDPNHTQGVEDFFNSLDLNIAQISIHDKNAYEYYGIHKIWELAAHDTHEYLIYLHTKGMSYKSKFTLGSGREAREIVLTYLTFKDHQKTIALFDEKKELVRVGAFPKKDDDSSDTSGCFIWFNFFWIRASYAKTLEEPIVTDNRFYYESWNSKDKIERGESYKTLTYSLYSKSHTGFTIHEASNLLKKLNKLYKMTWPLSALYLKHKIKS